jgi:hypothetical protein
VLCDLVPGGVPEEITAGHAAKILGQITPAAPAAEARCEVAAPAATVKIAAYQQSAGQWKLIGRHTVGQRNAWFWNVLTGPGAICRFSTSNLPPDRMRVRLLVSPSIGCSATYKFHIANGALAAR